MLCVCVPILNATQTHKCRNSHGDNNVVAPVDKRVIDSALLTEASEGAPWPQGPTGGIGTCQSIFLSLTHTLILLQLLLLIEILLIIKQNE